MSELFSLEIKAKSGHFIFTKIHLKTLFSRTCFNVFSLLGSSSQVKLISTESLAKHWLMLSHYLSPQGRGTIEPDRTQPPILTLSPCSFSLFDLFQKLQVCHSWLTQMLPGTLLPRTVPTGSLALTNPEGFLLIEKKLLWRNLLTITVVK